MSARKGDPNAAVASVGFDKLPVKSFDKKKIKDQIQGYQKSKNYDHHTAGQPGWQISNEIYEKDFAESILKTNENTEADFSEFDAYEVTDMNSLRKRFHEMIEYSQQALEEVKAYHQDQDSGDKGVIQEYMRERETPMD